MKRIDRETLIMLIATILVFFICIGAILIADHVKGNEKVEYREVEYVIRDGDTLWDIASRYKPNEVQIRKYVYDIQEENDITANIKPGQRIVLYTE